MNQISFWPTFNTCKVGPQSAFITILNIFSPKINQKLQMWQWHKHRGYENICKRLILGKKPKSRLKIHNPMLTMYLFAVPRAAWCRPPPAPRWPGCSSSCRRSAGRPAGSSGPGRRTILVGIADCCLLTGGYYDLSVAGENVYTFLF